MSKNIAVESFVYLFALLAYLIVFGFVAWVLEYFASKGTVSLVLVRVFYFSAGVTLVWWHRRYALD